MSGVPRPEIVTCAQWGARKPLRKPILVGRPNKIVFHATAGNAPQLARHPSSALAQAEFYARALQADMIENRGWNDSGHNFLVMRSGIIIQGRWGSISAIENGRMIESAHCPGQNNNPGIEHEAKDNQMLTIAQTIASTHLMAWICDCTDMSPTEIYPHSRFYTTACPGKLGIEIVPMRARVAVILNKYGRRKQRRLSQFVPMFHLDRELNGR